jgi:hypothetical protein
MIKFNNTKKVSSILAILPCGTPFELKGSVYLVLDEVGQKDARMCVMLDKNRMGQTLFIPGDMEVQPLKIVSDAVVEHMVTC